MVAYSRNIGLTDARFIAQGVISNGATWITSFELSENDVEIPNADTSQWRLILKKCESGSIDLTLSSGSEITITQNTTSTIFEISCPQASLSALCGDYYLDLVQKDGSDIIHWINGGMTVRDENLWVD